MRVYIVRAAGLLPVVTTDLMAALYYAEEWPGLRVTLVSVWVA